ncbi:MAG: hypothetical protein Q8K64_10845, partial [Sediminibacterium sp.]|nr:hypothetical protein [Sediminibacterium sp.]
YKYIQIKHKIGNQFHSITPELSVFFFYKKPVKFLLFQLGAKQWVEVLLIYRFIPVYSSLNHYQNPYKSANLVF